MWRRAADGAVFCAKYKCGVDSIVWRLTDQGLLYMDAILLNRASGGGGFDDAFMDTKVYNLGLTFSYPETQCTGMKWWDVARTAYGRPHTGHQLRHLAQGLQQYRDRREL